MKDHGGVLKDHADKDVGERGGVIIENEYPEKDTPREPGLKRADSQIGVKVIFDCQYIFQIPNCQ